MPAYNEAASIADAIDEVIGCILPVVTEAELIVVDDGSTDDTAALVEARLKELPALKLIKQRNSGHGAALIAGIEQSTGDALLLVDSDQQVSLADFREHWNRFQQTGCNAVLGIRKPRKDPNHRLFITTAMKLLILAVYGRTPQDAGVPYKIVNRSDWQEASRYIPDKSWIPSVLLAIFLVVRHGKSVLEIPVRHTTRPHGQSSLNLSRLLRFCFTATGEVVRFRQKLGIGK